MRALNITTLALVIIGGLNWLLVGLFDFDLVAAVFGGQNQTMARVVYVIVGISALWQIMPWLRALSVGELRAERAV
jgi:uncharacterized membrane protein YuzA (DUF378 family)